MSDRLLSIEGLGITYRVGRRRRVAVSDLDLSVNPGEIVGVVGESGCGKSSLALSILQLLPPNGAITGGAILFRGQDLTKLSGEALRRVRGDGIAIVFQDPLTSLNPTRTIGAQLRDPMVAHGRGSGPGTQAEIIDMLERVGIPDAPDRVGRYPHELSGGMRQRVMIAMALLLKPALIIADEPTSALDVTLQMQVLELLHGLRRDFGTAILLITHDFGVVSEVCDRTVVMYAGEAVEEGEATAIFESPRHPYTRALLGSIPSWRRRDEELVAIGGRVPRLSEVPAGCTFAERCAYTRTACLNTRPRYLSERGRAVRCHIYDASSAYPSGSEGDGTSAE